MGGKTLPRAEALAIVIDRVWGAGIARQALVAKKRIADK
jgi:hypothetical protein